MSIQQNKIRAIIEKIWSKVKEPKPMSGDGIVDAIDEVYESGEGNGIDMMWEFLQNGGKRVLYSSFFRELVLSEETVNPKYDIAPTSATLMFYQAKLPQSGKPLDIAEVEEKCGIKFDFSKVANMESLAQATDAISRFNVIDISSATNTYGMLWNCNNLKRVEKIIVSENTPFLAHAIESSNLEHCLFEGVIAKNGLTVQKCTKLDKESQTSIINCLSTTTTGLSVTMSRVAVNKAFETSEGANDGSTSAEWLALVNTKTNCTISLA